MTPQELDPNTSYDTPNLVHFVVHGFIDGDSEDGITVPVQFRDPAPLHSHGLMADIRLEHFRGCTPDQVHNGMLIRWVWDRETIHDDWDAWFEPVPTPSDWAEMVACTQAEIASGDHWICKFFENCESECN